MIRQSVKVFSSVILGLTCFIHATPSHAQELDGAFSSILAPSFEPFSSLPSASKAKLNKVGAAKLHTRAKKKDKKPKSVPSPFPGTWYTALTQKKNTCANTLPASLNVGIKIDAKFNGTDIADGSPFFTGKILAANKIGFARMRKSAQCTQTQNLVLGNVVGNKGFTVIQTDTVCGAQSCQTVYSGNSSKR